MSGLKPGGVNKNDSRRHSGEKTEKLTSQLDLDGEIGASSRVAFGDISTSTSQGWRSKAHRYQLAIVEGISTRHREIPITILFSNQTVRELS